MVCYTSRMRRLPPFPDPGPLDRLELRSSTTTWLPSFTASTVIFPPAGGKGPFMDGGNFRGLPRPRCGFVSTSGSMLPGWRLGRLFISGGGGHTPPVGGRPGNITGPVCDIFIQSPLSPLSSESTASSTMCCKMGGDKWILLYATLQNTRKCREQAQHR